jgi:hypothetical protein
MTRDNGDRLTMFARFDVRIERLALNMDQVERYAPPPNPAKEADSRASDYILRYGRKSWELDALEPTVIVQLIRDAIEPLINRRKWNAALKAETDGRDGLKAVSDRWDDVREFVR